MPTRLEAIKQHLRGVKKRLLYTFVAFGIGAALTWYYKSTIILWLIAPARGQISETWQPIFTGPTEMLSLTIRVSLLGGVVVALPVLAFGVARTISPFLNAQQRRFVVLFLPSAFVCYLTGAAFAYWVLLPTGLGFLLKFGTDVAAPMLRITEYMDLVLAMLFWLGVIFELPLAMLLATKLQVVSYRRLKSLRRYVPAMAFILSAIITPTADVVNWILVGLPIIFLFEVGLFLSWLARPKGTG